MMINEAQAQATAASGRGDGRYPSGLHDGSEISTAAGGQTKAEVPLTMEAVITRENLMLAYQRVVENKGVAELKPWLKKNWRSVWQVLIDGNYQPRAIRRMDIPKPDGGVRTLDIPTVVDRLIQQAIAQQLSAIVDKSFSDSSYGFRPGRNAWQAVQQAQRYIRGSKRWVVDMDLEKFFDRVDHRLLMTRLARTIKDRRVLRLIRCQRHDGPAGAFEQKLTVLTLRLTHHRKALHQQNKYRWVIRAYREAKKYELIYHHQ